MRILVTGASGRVGRAIVVRLSREHEVIGLDATPSSTADLVGDVGDRALIGRALDGVDAVVHTAALHAPHVGWSSDEEFERVNVTATVQLARLAVAAGVRRFVLTSTTALYGAAATAGGAALWVDETVEPRPRTVYHRTKLAAERALAELAATGPLAITALRMSRCFPEPAPFMAICRLHRGVDARDVAAAHELALAVDRPGRPGFERFVVSGATPFSPQDAVELGRDAPRVLARRAPGLVAAFAARGWPLPPTIDRVYSPGLAMRELGWRPRFGFEEVLAMLDAESAEVLPPGREIAR